MGLRLVVWWDYSLDLHYPCWSRSYGDSMKPAPYRRRWRGDIDDRTSPKMDAGRPGQRFRRRNRRLWRWWPVSSSSNATPWNFSARFHSREGNWCTAIHPTSTPMTYSNWPRRTSAIMRSSAGRLLFGTGKTVIEEWCGFPVSQFAHSEHICDLHPFVLFAGRDSARRVRLASWFLL